MTDDLTVKPEPWTGSSTDRILGIYTFRWYPTGNWNDGSKHAEWHANDETLGPTLASIRKHYGFEPMQRAAQWVVASPLIPGKPPALTVDIANTAPPPPSTVEPRGRLYDGDTRGEGWPL